MHSHRWLLVLVIALIVVNLAFFFAIHTGRMDRWVQNRLVEYLRQELKSDVQIGSFDLNDRQINIYKVHFATRDTTVQLDVPRVYISYNLFRVVLSGVKLSKAFDRVVVYNPVAHLRLPGSSTSGKHPSSGRFEDHLPDITPYFRTFELKQGTCVFTWTDRQIQVQDSLADINLTLSNRNNTTLRLHAGNTLSAEVRVNRSHLQSARVYLRNFRPDRLASPWVDKAEGALSAEISYRNHAWSYHGGLSDLRIDARGHSAVADYIDFSGNEKFATVAADRLQIDRDSLGISATLPFSSAATLEATIQARLGLEGIITRATGNVAAVVQVSGNYHHPIAQVRATCPTLEAAGMTFEDAELNGRVTPQSAEITSLDFTFNHAPVHAEGTFEDWKRLRLQATSGGFRQQLQGFDLAGDVTSEIVYSADSLQVRTKLANVSAVGNGVKLDGLNADCEYRNNRIELALSNRERTLLLKLNGGIQDSTGVASVELSRFRVESIFPELANRDLPPISGTLKLDGNPANCLLQGNLSLARQDSAPVYGNLAMTASVDFLHQRSMLYLRTTGAQFHDEPFDLDLLATGSLDSLHTTFCRLNRELNLELRAERQPKFAFGFRITGHNLNLPRYMRYIEHDDSSVEGLANIDLSWNLDGRQSIAGAVRLTGFRMDSLNPLDTQINLHGTPDRLHGSVAITTPYQRPVAQLDMQGALLPKLALDADVRLSDTPLDTLLVRDTNLWGTVGGSLHVHHDAGSNTGSFSLHGTDLFLGDLQLDSLQVTAHQEPQQLRLDSLKASLSFLHCTGEGALGYNVFENRAVPDSSRIRLHLNGDLFRAMSDNLPKLHHGRSEVHADIELAAGDEGLDVPSAQFMLKNGSLQVEDQPEKIEDADIDLAITDNVLNIRRFRLQIGDNNLYLRNVLDSAATEDDEFRLGRLRLGNLRLYTDPEGVWVHVPNYTPPRSQAQAIVMGHLGNDADLWKLDPAANPFQVNGPFDDIHIVGDVIFSNGNIIYPPQSHNLLEVIGKKHVQKNENEEVELLPFTLDVWLRLRDNVRYATYPANFQLDQGSLLHLTYTDDWHSPDIDLRSEKGTLDIFGATFNVDQVSVQMDPLNRRTQMIAHFHKRVQDGSTVQLNIVPQDGMPNTFENLKIELSSDSDNGTGETSVIDILSKLRYGRTRDQLSQSQQQALLQDEAIELAGVQIESSYITPFISPLENEIRRALGLDFFYIKPGFIRNLIFEYTSTDNTTDNQKSSSQAELVQFGAGILLNNMSIDAGKYLTRKLFVDYNVLFQEATDLRSKRLVINHNFSLRYDLPYSFKLDYTYTVNRVTEKNTHEIMLERSFRF